MLRRLPGASAGHAAVWVIAGILALINLVGAPYYLLSRASRVRSPLHPWLRPSGYIGQSAGLLALAIFIFLWLYPLRKKFRSLAWTGSIARWLDVHVLLALALPLLVAIHASWHFTGVIGLGFWAMMIVWASGVIGRYIYSRIPRGKAGIELSLDEIAANRHELLARDRHPHRAVHRGSRGDPRDRTRAHRRARPGRHSQADGDRRPGPAPGGADAPPAVPAGRAEAPEAGPGRTWPRRCGWPIARSR